MKRIIGIILVALLISSCSKTEKDFVGNYKILQSSKLKLKSEFNTWGMSRYSSSKKKSDTKEFYELSPLVVRIYMDEQNKVVNGEAEAILLTANNFSYSPTIEKSKFDFDLVNFRMDNDTLRFQMKNDLASLAGTKFNGFIYKENESTIIGIDNDFFGINNFTEKNPLYIENKNNQTIYKALNENENADSVFKEFYNTQILEFKLGLELAENEYQKDVLNNSISVLEEKINSIVNK